MTQVVECSPSKCEALSSKPTRGREREGNMSFLLPFMEGSQRIRIVTDSLVLSSTCHKDKTGPLRPRKENNKWAISQSLYSGRLREDSEVVI
jgi:hypothetical protein